MQASLDPTTLPEWSALAAHAAQARHWHLRELFAQHPRRFPDFLLKAPGLSIDYSRQLIDGTTLDLLCRLAERLKLREAITALMSGAQVNHSEQRAAWHTALRSTSSTSVSGEVQATLARMEAFADAVRTERYRGYSGKPIRTVINIGIGGSDLGPKMATYALHAFGSPAIRNHFVSNLDLRHLHECLAAADPDTTLFIVSSKTFTTRETLANLEAARAWLQRAAGTHDISGHFVAVTAAPARARDLGFAEERLYPFWDWVGGRFSIWSAVSLSMVIAIGMPAFQQFLAGAAAMDEHFATAPFAENAPVLLGLLAVWYTNFWHCQTQAIIPYYQGLALFPDYLQQLCMESLGKSVRFDGAPVDYVTGGIIWGGSGTNSQHSFHQLLQQGTHKVPVDFIFPLRVPEHVHTQSEMIAHCLAQSEVFAFGYDPSSDHVKGPLAAQQRIVGNQPHSMIMLNALNPFSLGALIALYEHKVYVQSVLWQINAFDQWGVQRAKALTAGILADLQSSTAQSSAAATNLKAWVRGHLSHD